MKDKYGNEPFKTIIYRGQTIDFYDDDYGQCVYFYYKGREYSCGTYNLDYENEMNYIVDRDLDFVKSVKFKDLTTTIYKTQAGDEYWFNYKAGAEQRLFKSKDLLACEKAALDDMKRFDKLISRS